MVPPLVVLCVHVLAEFPDQLHQTRVHASPALLDAFSFARHPRRWAAFAQLVYPLPPHLHDIDVPLAHPDIPLLQNIPDNPDFSLLTLLSLPNCTHLHDGDVADFRSLRRLVALDLRGCAISPYALTALARGLTIRSGTWGLRLLSLHGCPNMDDDVLSPLLKFPLLSAIDLRFTRCTPAAVNARLSPLGFYPSENNALFHPAPLSLALYSLEKVAASDHIALYSCPPQSVFRIHVDELSPPSRTSKPATSIQTTTSAEDIVVFVPPLQKPPLSDPLSSSLVDQPTVVSNASSFYENTPARDRHHILPLSAQAVHTSAGGKLDPLAIARPPPPWNTLDTYTSESTRRTQPAACWIGRTLNNPLKVDRNRLHKCDSDAIADMVHQFATKRPKIESEFSRARTRAKVSVKPRNPFVKSVFTESDTITSDKPRSQESHKEPEPPSTRHPATGVEGTLKPLKPITSLKPPILPKELLPSLPNHTPKPKIQTRLAFSRQV